MVEYINKAVCRGVAGKRVGAVKGVVIHNDAGSRPPADYVAGLSVMTDLQLERGFAHYYIDRFTVARTEDTFNRAWHTANPDGNNAYIGYEVCQSLSASDEDFLANEQAVFKQAADDLKYYGLPVNRDTVKLHREFSSTDCPHRSWALHGQSINSVKDYFISQIKLYYSGEEPVIQPEPAAKPATRPQTNQHRYRVDDLQFVNGYWQIRCNELVPEDFNWTDNGIPVENVVEVDSQGYFTDDQLLHVGELFVINSYAIKGVSNSGWDAGHKYFYTQFNFVTGGNVWLSAWDSNHLLNG